MIISTKNITLKEASKVEFNINDPELCYFVRDKEDPTKFWGTSGISTLKEVYDCDTEIIITDQISDYEWVADSESFELAKSDLYNVNSNNTFADADFKWLSFTDGWVHGELVEDRCLYSAHTISLCDSDGEIFECVVSDVSYFKETQPRLFRARFTENAPH